MQIIDNLNAFQHLGKIALTIGNFDGIHLGHQALISQFVTKSKACGLKPVVMLFEPHPCEFFLGDDAPPRLTAFEDKCRRMTELGIEAVFKVEFNHAFSSLSASEFIQHYVVQANVGYVFVGHDFRFGQGRVGDIDFLRQCANLHQFDVDCFNPYCVDGIRVSSSLIRESLAKGDLDKAGTMLGRAYEFTGPIIRGEQLGRRLGFPTINLAPPGKWTPMQGVYVAQVNGIAEGCHYGVASIGTRPTIGGKQSLVEMHILDFDRECYGECVSVRPLEKLRDEWYFASLDAMVVQMNRDLIQAKAALLPLLSSAESSGVNRGEMVDADKH